MPMVKVVPEMKIVFDGQEVSIREFKAEPERTSEIVTEFPIPSERVQFEWSFECQVKPSPKFSRFIARLTPKPKRAGERRSKRHMKRPPTRGYWARRCTCSACLFLRDRVVRVGGEEYLLTFSEGKMTA